ncbi:hypothetical protein [Leuconostoc citreum]|uniref:Uncharacterized protein n=1 Tax=Leuconostoc citreum TaxID=33964 RepID=D5MP65_LEUCI|nr:hypothetical protein [Leuconostoc citreum]BAJ07253.1 hypothetical protein [Leuconostoc citreum]
MADKNIFEKLFWEAENTNLQVLMDNALNEKDPDKKKVLHAIYENTCCQITVIRLSYTLFHQSIILKL